MNTANNDIRWLFTARLRTLSALRIGTGGRELEIKDFGLTQHFDAEKNAALTAVQATEVMTGHDGQPFIPGSSLRGVLRALFSQACSAEDGKVDALFGFARGDQGHVGCLRVFDCPMAVSAMDAEFNQRGQNKKRRTELHARTAIDPVHRTALDAHLAHEEVVPVGSDFELRIELTGTEAQARELTALLQALAGEQGGLGQGRSHGRGRIEVRQLSIRRLDAAGLQRWLAQSLTPGGADSSPWGAAVACQVAADENLLQQTRRRWLGAKLRLQFETPLLVADPAKAKRKGDPEDAANAQPRLTPEGYALLPGSSLKGALRSQALRIARTLGWRDDIPAPVAQLFGHTQGAGWLRFVDLVSTEHAQLVHDGGFEFVAIDRFSGGAADGLKFKLQAVLKADLQGALALDFNRLQTGLQKDQEVTLQSLGLLALLLRDLLEGDVAFGGHQAKGFGRARASLTGWAPALQTLTAALREAGLDLPADADWRTAASLCIAALRRGANASSARNEALA